MPRNFAIPGGGLNSMAARLAVGLVVVSVLNRLVPDFFLVATLNPRAVLDFHYLWQPFLYVLTEVDVVGILFGALILYSIGGSLELVWGPRRFLRFALGVTMMAGILTVLLSLLMPSLKGRDFIGGQVMVSSLWVAYGLSFGRGQTNFWGIPVSGNGFAAIGAGFVLLNGLFSGMSRVVPELFGLGLTFWYVRSDLSPARWLHQFAQWRFQRQVRRRSKHLQIISKERNIRGDSDRFLH